MYDRKYDLIASLVLFFYNRINGGYIISKDSIDKIYDVFKQDKHLDIEIDNFESNYIYSEDEKNNLYLVLKNDYDVKKWESLFFSMPLEFYNVIMSIDVLGILNVKFSENKLKKYSK